MRAIQSHFSNRDWAFILLWWGLINVLYSRKVGGKSVFESDRCHYSIVILGSGKEKKLEMLGASMKEH